MQFDVTGLPLPIYLAVLEVVQGASDSQWLQDSLSRTLLLEV